MLQSVNLEGILYYPFVRLVRKTLAVPHFSVKDIREINPVKLKEYGFKGLIFDKDNTLTAPYVNELYPSIKEAFLEYKEVFGDRMIIMSNSAGVWWDDRGYKDALRIEDDLGIKVLRHFRKKPGGIKPVIEYFGCHPSELVMFGDRVFTDIVFGNRYKMLTVLSTLLTEEGDNKNAAKVRRYELPLIQGWMERGLRAPTHEMYHEDIRRRAA